MFAVSSMSRPDKFRSLYPPLPDRRNPTWYHYRIRGRLTAREAWRGLRRKRKCMYTESCPTSKWCHFILNAPADIGLKPFKAKGSRGSGQPKPEAMQPKPSEKLQLLHVYPPDNHRLASPKPQPKKHESLCN